MLDWIFEGIVTWISSVVSDMMDTVSGLFLQALGTDMTAMEEYFPFVSKAFTVMQYRIASRCIFCPADTTESVVLRAMDKELLQWLKNAGVRLTVAELVYLVENGIKPTQDLLHTDNRQRLIERIYTVDTIADNLLENQMETVKCRDAVVQSLMRLLKKKLVLVL